MPKVRIFLSSDACPDFAPERVFEYGDEEWGFATPQERQQMINEDAENLIAQTVDWDYRVL